MDSDSLPGIVTLLFTDIEGSTRLWEQEPERMPPALACHDALVRRAVESNHGVVVKMIGDGVHAAFDDALDGLKVTLALQQALADPAATNGLSLRVRCGLHVGAVERRDNDFFGSTVNHAARIMGAAHGGQVLLSQAVAALIGDRLPAGVTLRNLGSVRLRDVASPEQVYQLVHPQLREEFPALRSLEATPNNLPQQVTSFVGRAAELAEVKALLGKTRLLTLLGVGGIGKTRLSLQVAADAMDDYPDGVWFVELAPLTDARIVPQAVASVLGVKEEAGRPEVEALVRFVKDRRLLLILDNCEHLVHACAELAKQLLQSGAHVKVLASSREHLNVVGETTYPVPALAAPDPQKTITLAALTQYEAVQLFIDRAVAAQSAFQITQQNATAVADICHRLDGIPLAVELAAARVRALSVEKLAERLNDRFHLLTGGDQTALPRQQTLRACIDWSYALLTGHERALLRRLAVFAGGWTLEAAEAVCVGGEVDQSDVLDLLTHLVEKSLTVLEPREGRYRLLETLWEYAQEKLNESGERDGARARHLAFYLSLAEEVGELEFGGAEQGARLSRLDLERENLLLAHASCELAEGETELGLRLVVALMKCNYWVTRGLLGLGRRVTVEALARAGVEERNLARCVALLAASQLVYFMGRYGEAQGYLEEALSIAREIGDKERTAVALRLLGDVFHGTGDPAAAQQHLEEALVIARELRDKNRLSSVLSSLAELHRGEGNLDLAETLYEEALALARETGNRGAIAVLLLDLAMVSIARGLGVRRRDMLIEAFTIIDEIGSKWAGRLALNVSFGLAVFLGEWERAARLHGAAEAHREDIGYHPDPVDERFVVPLSARTREVLGDEVFSAAESAGHALSYDEAIAEARAWLENRP